MKFTAILSIGLLAFAFASQAQNTPKATYLSGTAKVTVWENEKEGKHGTYTEKNFKVERIYKKDDKWESSSYYSLTELMQLRAAIDKAILTEAVERKELKHATQY